MIENNYINKNYSWFLVENNAEFEAIFTTGQGVRVLLLEDYSSGAAGKQITFKKGTEGIAVLNTEAAISKVEPKIKVYKVRMEYPGYGPIWITRQHTMLKFLE